MKTPEEILRTVKMKEYPYFEGIREDDLSPIGRVLVIEAMKEFGRQVWLRCASGFEEAGPVGRESVLYDDYLNDLYLNQIAKDSQERGEYEI
jgi:hypothetical protein